MRNLTKYILQKEAGFFSPEKKYGEKLDKPSDIPGRIGAVIGGLAGASSGLFGKNLIGRGVAGLGGGVVGLITGQGLTRNEDDHAYAVGARTKGSPRDMAKEIADNEIEEWLESAGRTPENIAEAKANRAELVDYYEDDMRRNYYGWKDN